MATPLYFNGAIYDGTPVTNPTHPYKPDTLACELQKVGKTIITANGGRIFMARGFTKRTWTIGWKTANETTRAALRSLHLLVVTFVFIDQFGASYTVQTEDSAGDYHEVYVLTDRNNNLYYDLTLIAHEV